MDSVRDLTPRPRAPNPDRGTLVLGILLVLGFTLLILGLGPWSPRIFGDWYDAPARWELLEARTRSVLIKVEHEACDRLPEPQVTEDGGRVHVTQVASTPGGVECPAVVEYTRVEVPLSRSLGDRRLTGCDPPYGTEPAPPPDERRDCSEPEPTPVRESPVDVVPD